MWHLFRASIFLALCLQGAAAAGLSLAQTTFEVGEVISVEFSGGPENASDWIGIYQSGVIPDGSPGATAWLYSNGTRSAAGNASEGEVTFASGLGSGRYAAWFLANNGYEPLAGPVEFTVSDFEKEPAWVIPKIRRRHAIVGEEYSGKISAYANYPILAFSKVSGPDWLKISNAGVLSGTPGPEDTGAQSFEVRVSGVRGQSDATLQIEVCASGAEVVHELKIMSYNAWHGWGKMNEGYRKGLESIILSGADIIGMQESTDNVSGSGGYQPEKLARDLGWYYRRGIKGSLGIVSRYPIVGELLEAGVARGARILVSASPRQEVILMTCHLDFRRYGPYAARKEGATADSVMEVELGSQRDEQIATIMDEMKVILGEADRVPVFLTGDFNAPSHLDWNGATAARHGGVESVTWPTSTRVAQDGMRDSYRVIHPRPEVKPGDTWSPVFKGDEAQDRIDFIYYKGNQVMPVASEVFTTAVEKTVGLWGASTVVTRDNTWPSDHASVVTDFRFRADGAEKRDGLRVLVWNVWHGTNDVENGPEKALKLIRDSRADVCLLQESYDINGERPNFGAWAAGELGWDSWQGKSPHLCVMTRFQIEKKFLFEPWHALGAEIKDEKGRTFHAFSTWLDSGHYLPYLLEDKPEASDEELLACELTNSRRLVQMEKILADLKEEGVLSLETPLLVGGDWNCPSHLDWTAETAVGLPYRRALPLPVSLKMKEAGFVDTYRQVHPDPVKNPGNTWSPLFVKRNGKAAAMDRIDRLYLKGPWLKAVRATVFPEKLEDVKIPTLKRKHPSDHAAVLIEFEWVTAPGLKGEAKK